MPAAGRMGVRSVTGRGLQRNQYRQALRPVLINGTSLDNNRLLISIIVVLGILFLYQELLQWRYPDLYGPKSKLAQKAGKASGAATLGPVAGPTPIALAPESNGLANGSVKPGEITAAS